MLRLTSFMTNFKCFVANQTFGPTYDHLRKFSWRCSRQVMVRFIQNVSSQFFDNEFAVIL
uniref:Uncharacterized protein n=1 Tax=Kalanchoe fedtschenkoi TaxID=63787 RepID=A0A7N0UP80_KALFE